MTKISGKYNVKQRWAIVLVLLLVALFVRLGFWQLSRAEEKRALLAANSERAAQPPLTRLPGDEQAEPLRYRKVRLMGYYDAARQVLLDNQVYNGRVGYQVLTPLIASGEPCAVLINRGWVPASPMRSQLPELPMNQLDAQVEGRIDHFQSTGWRLQGADALDSNFPVVAQYVDAEQLSKRLGYCLKSYQILMVPEAGEGYVRDWKMQHIDPDKSLGYAVQWFALALGLAGYSVWVALRRPTDGINQ
ncbi:MAG: SURF1 family protein [Methylococcaceae bacterium]|nr:MAG: SURF1 family protein [Methylococcaceae bacterium]